MGNPGV